MIIGNYEMNEQEVNDTVVAYIGTIWDFIQGKDEDGIRETVEADAELMSEDEKALTLALMDKIIAEALAEMEQAEQ